MDEMIKKQKKWERTNVTNMLRNSASGQYYVRVKVNGKQKWRSLETDVAAVAKARLPAEQESLREQEIAASGYSSTSLQGANRFKVGRFIELFLGNLNNRRKLAPASKSRIQDTVKTLLKTWPQLPDCDVRRLTPSDCQAWATRALKSGSGFVAPNTKTKRIGMSPSGFNKCVDALKGILELARKEGALFRNPANEVEKQAPKKKRLELPTLEQFQAIVAEVKTAGSRWSLYTADLLRLLAYSGARLREATTLRWSHVDETRGVITIPGTKSEASKDRPLPLFPSLKALLVEMRGRPLIERLDPATGRIVHPRKDYITQVEECMVSLKNACRKVGVIPMDHHDLRHLFATRCIESGVDIPTVSKWLGHADGGTLAMKTYGHLRQEHSLAQAAKVTF